MQVFAGLKEPINTFGQIALGVILLVAFYKVTIAYIRDQPIKSMVKKFVGACIFIGAAAGLVDLSVFVGEYLVAPIKTIITGLVDSIVEPLKNRRDGG
ncbi:MULTISPECIES: hypothetical protein [Laceyella]|uniref:Holin n=1 Tax=Laceyella sacchari TaxID=37482 RepID=A0ABY5U778_LACSH|nr:hypothetical protein [Laceyella sacchari]KPC75522.1 hypothetical protein ADL26_07500 [Thermoactinomyces vulgaris]MRG28495.1 hypothetical protein [Laceyella tengchongensis]UWE04885.1 hypothetical protein NYR52_07130 [Laceyella sacchari]